MKLMEGKLIFWGQPRSHFKNLEWTSCLIGRGGISAKAVLITWSQQWSTLKHFDCNVAVEFGTESQAYWLPWFKGTQNVGLNSGMGFAIYVCFSLPLDH